MLKQIFNLTSKRLAFSPLFNYSLQKIKFILIDQKNQKHEIIATEGQNLLLVLENAKVNFFGACDGNMACGTCHVILDKNLAKKLKKPQNKELDLLDSIIGSVSTSRLACQLKITKEFENSSIYLPKNSTHMEFEK